MDHQLKIVLLLYVLSYNVGAYLNPVQVTTISNLKFGHINSIIIGPSKNLIIADSSAVWNVNIKTVPYTKHIIAGSATLPGYREGTAGEARFNQPRSVTLKNETHVLVADSWNHCLRAIDLLTYETSRYSGTCRSAGLRNGYRIAAKFNAPRGLLNFSGKIYIADTENHAVRVLDVDYVGTLKSGLPLNYPYYLASSTDNVLFVTGFSGIFRISGDGTNIKRFTGSLIPGFIDGNLESSRYHYPYGITHLDNHTLAVADNWSNRLRIVDLESDRVSSICSGEKATIDGNRTHCRFFWPYSVLVYGDSILVGEAGGKIRKLSLYSFIHEPDPAPLTIEVSSSTATSNRSQTTYHSSRTRTPVRHVRLEYLGFLSVIVTVVVIVGTVLILKRKRRTADNSKPTEDAADISMIMQYQRHVPPTPTEDNIYEEVTIDEATIDSAYAVYVTTSEKNYIVPNSEKPQILYEYSEGRALNHENE